jgi:dynein heavy chain
MPNKDFTYQRASDCSHAVKFLYSWVKAIYDYNDVYTKTQPLRDQLMSVKKVVAEKTYELQLKKEALEKVNNRIKELEDLYNAKIQLKESLAK